MLSVVSKTPTRKDKMAKMLFILLIAFIVHSNIINAQPEVSPVPRCGRNAIWSDCASRCPSSCEGLNDPNPRLCPAVCVRGCKCLPGYIRISNTSPNCILEKDCPKKDPKVPRCGRNAVWSSCASYCPPNCESLNDPDPIMCPAVCVKGCTCRQGYIRMSKSNATCILRRICPHMTGGK